MQLIQNAGASRHAPYTDQEIAIVSVEQARNAGQLMRRCPHYAQTPLHSFDQLATRLGVARLFVKDETSRLGLSSFKALGGAYAVLRRSPSFAAKPDAAAKNAGSVPTFVTATDGNHGISVAAGAWLTGAKAVCFLPKHVAPPYESAMRLFGAELIHVGDNYDRAVAQAASAAKENGWTLVSDTTDAPFDPITRDVLSGYGVMVEECVSQLEESRQLEAVTHVFVQGGVGGLAAAIAGGLWQRLESRRPTFVVVEPRSADCLYQSALQGELSNASGDLETAMSMLSCGRPSRMAWSILRTAADFFITIDDVSAIAGAAAFAAEPATRGRETTPSGASGLGGLIEAATLAEARQTLGLDDRSVVLAVCSERRPDVDAFERLVSSRR